METKFSTANCTLAKMPKILHTASLGTSLRNPSRPEVTPETVLLEQQEKLKNS